jgi:hypothetical protein
MAIKCTRCGCDIDSIGQDNVSYIVGSPCCESCQNTGGYRTDGCPDDCSLCGDYCVYDENND